MAHPRSLGRFSHVRGSKRQTEWDSLPFREIASSAVGSTLYSFGFVPVVSGLTIIRLRGELIVSSLMNAATDAMQLATGIIMVSDEAFAAGVASIPSPVTDEDDDWMWHQWHSVQSGTLGAPGQGTEYRFIIDNKAMRKFPTGKTICAVTEVIVEAGTVVVDTILNIRALIKLP